VAGGWSIAQDEREAATIEYLFTGKLTLFPLAILFLGIGAGVLLRYGDKPYLGGYFQSVEMYYGIAGAPPVWDPLALSSPCARVLAS
jgi:hypothetical protein